MKMRLLVSLVACLTIPLSLGADYLEVRRDATIKKEPAPDATVRSRPDIGEFLALIEPTQTNGYYRAQRAGEPAGWVYRTLVRRHPGTLPGQPNNNGGGNVEDPADPAEDPGADIPAYDRNEWQHWIDEDGDCQSTRNEVLIRDADGPITFRPRADGRQCAVASGRWVDPYSGNVFTDPADLDIDHMVPLKNAHLSGGWAWDDGKRRDYANDLQDGLHLIAVRNSLNRSKSDKGPDLWKPPSKSYWCTYATTWEAIKDRWELSLTTTEAAAVAMMKQTC
jgi:hypothetical protein